MREQAEGTSLWRRSGAIRWTVSLLLILVVPQVTLWVTLDTINGRRVERKLQAIRNAGQPVTISEAAPPPVPDDQNAAVLYQQILRVDFNHRRQSTDSLLEATGHSKLIVSEFGKDGSNADRAQAVLNDPAIVDILETLEQASLRPECAFPIRWESRMPVPLPHLIRLLRAAQWLSAKARLCTIDGDPDEALRWLGVVFRMSDHCSRGPTINAQYIAAALQRTGLEQLERTLSQTTPSAKSTRDVLDCLERLDIKVRFDQALPGERAEGIDSYTRLRYPPPQSVYPPSPRFAPTRLLYCYRFGLFRPLYNADLSKYLTRMEEVMHRATLPSAQPTPPRPPRRLPRRWVPFGLDHMLQFVEFLGALDDLLEMRDVAIMENNIGRVALALTLYKIERGEYPATLDELQATLNWKLPEDFFAGAAMTYQRRGDGFLLYSFGVDRDDDGGVKGVPRNGDLVWETKVP